MEKTSTKASFDYLILKDINSTLFIVIVMETIWNNAIIQVIFLNIRNSVKSRGL